VKTEKKPAKSSVDPKQGEGETSTELTGRLENNGKVVRDRRNRTSRHKVSG